MPVYRPSSFKISDTAVHQGSHRGCLPFGRRLPAAEEKMQAQSLERSCGGKLLGCCRALCILQLEAPGSPHPEALCACMMRQVSHDACASLASSQAKGQSMS